MEFLVFGLPIVYWFVNRLRGGGYIKKGGNYIAAAATGLVVGGLTLNPVAGGAAAVAYFVGEMFSWGKWISAAPHFFDKSWQSTYNATLMSRNDGRDSGIHAIAKMLFDESKNFTSYCITALALRGVWWWAPVFVSMVFTANLSIPVAIVCTLAAGVTMPIAFYVAGKSSATNYWEYGEHICGAIHGAALALALWSILS